MQVTILATDLYVINRSNLTCVKILVASNYLSHEVSITSSRTPPDSLIITPLPCPVYLHDIRCGPAENCLLPLAMTNWWKVDVRFTEGALETEWS